MYCNLALYKIILMKCYFGNVLVYALINSLTINKNKHYEDR